MRTGTATIKPNGLTYNSAAKQFTVPYPGGAVTYTVGAGAVTDDRLNQSTFPVNAGRQPTELHRHGCGRQLQLRQQRQQPDFGELPLSKPVLHRRAERHHLLCRLTPTTGSRHCSTLPETTRYAFTPADGNTYLIHYNDVQVVFPVIAGANVNAGVATVGSDIFTI